MRQQGPANKKTKTKNYNSDNWEHELLIIFVTWQLRVTLDSICNSCDVFFNRVCLANRAVLLSLQCLKVNNAKSYYLITLLLGKSIEGFRRRKVCIIVKKKIGGYPCTLNSFSGLWSFLTRKRENLSCDRFDGGRRRCSDATDESSWCRLVCSSRWCTNN